MNKKVFFMSLGLLVLIFGALTINAFMITDEEVTRIKFYASVMDEQQMCETIQKESLLNIPNSQRTFSYLELKEGVNCLDGN